MFLFYYCDAGSIPSGLREVTIITAPGTNPLAAGAALLKELQNIILGVVANSGLDRLSIFHDDESGDTDDAELGSQCHLVIHIDLADGDGFIFCCDFL